MQVINGVVEEAFVMPGPQYEIFEVTANSAAQLADAGWYYWVSFGGFELGDPEGPYLTKEIANAEANSMYGTVH